MTHTNESNEICRGAVYYIDLGKPDGTSKQAGIRPCVILSSAINNRFSPTVNILAFSASLSKKKRMLPVHVYFTAEQTGLPRDCVCLCEQPMTVAKSELQRYVTTLTAEQMERISAAVRLQLSI